MASSGSSRPICSGFSAVLAVPAWSSIGSSSGLTGTNGAANIANYNAAANNNLAFGANLDLQPLDPNNGGPTIFATANLNYTPPTLSPVNSDTSRYADEWTYFLANADVSSEAGVQRVLTYTIDSYKDKPDTGQNKLLKSMAEVGGIGATGYLNVGGDLAALVDAFGYGWADLQWFTINAMKSAFIGFDERLAIINTVIKPGYAALMG